MENSRQITVALLGCGMMGQEHISYMKKYRDIHLKFLCDPNKTSIEKALSVLFQKSEEDVPKSKKYEGHFHHDEPIIFNSEREMFADPQVALEVDLLVIATPNYCHTPQLLKWARRPITILVEKPVAISLRQIRALRTASHTFKADIWVAMEYRYIPAIQKLLQLRDSIGPIKKITIRENRYPFLSKIEEWNKDIDKSGDTLVEKCCHFFDLFRLISRNEMKSCKAMVHRGLNFNNYGYQNRNDNPVPIIDSAYVLLDFQPKEMNEDDQEETKTIEGNKFNQQKWNTATLGCLELCMFAEGSRHQEEIIVTGLKGRVEAYLPENKVFHYERPNNLEWYDRSIPPPKSSIKEVIHDCSDLKKVYDFADEIPKHSGYHYCSTAIEWKFLIDEINAKRNPDISKFTPQVSLEDGIRAVEMGISAMGNIVNEGTQSSMNNECMDLSMTMRQIDPVIAFETISSADLTRLALMSSLSSNSRNASKNELKECQ